MRIQKYYFCTEKANNVLYCEKLGYYFMFGKFKYVLFSSNIPYTIWSEVVCGTPVINFLLSHILIDFHNNRWLIFQNLCPWPFEYLVRPTITHLYNLGHNHRLWQPSKLSLVLNVQRSCCELQKTSINIGLLFHFMLKSSKHLQIDNNLWCKCRHIRDILLNLKW